MKIISERPWLICIVDLFIISLTIPYSYANDFYVYIFSDPDTIDQVTADPSK